MATLGRISFGYPALVSVDALSELETGSAETAFSVAAQGMGSFNGLSYTVPAHAKGTLEAAVQVMAMTSKDVKKLNKLVKSMVSASKWEKVKEQEKISASADLSLWRIFSAGASSSYAKTREKMSGFGLNNAQIDKVVDELFKAAQKMSSVELEFTIDNTENDYSVSGDLQLYTIGGKISTSKGTTEYRMLANRGTAGEGTAKAEGGVFTPPGA